MKFESVESIEFRVLSKIFPGDGFVHIKDAEGKEFLIALCD